MSVIAICEDISYVNLIQIRSNISLTNLENLQVFPHSIEIFTETLPKGKQKFQEKDLCQQKEATFKHDGGFTNSAVWTVLIFAEIV